MISLKKEDVDKIFENATDSVEALTEIYKLVFRDDWEKIQKMEGWPECGRKTWIYICDKFIELDSKNKENVFQGGLWLNRGFSVNGFMEEWKVNIDNCKITFKEK